MMQQPLNTKIIDGTDLFVYKEVKSTMDVAARLLDFSYNDFAVAAHSQTCGVGRNNKQWLSPSGNLYISIVKKASNHNNILQLPIVTAVVIGDFISSFFDLSFVYKWPNDIMIDGKKVAGILLRKDGDFVIIGIGVNLASAPCETATKLPEKDFEIGDLYEKIILLNNEYYRRWFIGGFDFFKKSWMKNAMGVNKDVFINKNIFVGRFLGIDDSGAMMVENNNKINLIYDAELVRFQE